MGGLPVRLAPDYNLGAGVTPNDLNDDGNDWKYAATAEAGSPYTSDPKELFGVRGAHVVDPDPTVNTAWQTTSRPARTCRSPCSTPASGGTTRGTMLDLRKKIRLNKGELPTPNHDGAGARAGGELRELRHRQRHRTGTPSSTSSITPATRA